MSTILFDDFTLVRKPLDPASGKPFDHSKYALFPGLSLAQSEPQIIVLLYDSLLQQYPDTAMFLHPGRDGADPLLNRKYSERLLTQWRKLGKPVVILVTPEDMKFFRGILTEVPTVSLYDLLLEHHISGGCSHELYRISEPKPFGFEPALRELAEGMGATLYTPQMTSAGAQSPSGSQDSAGAPYASIDPADVSKIPFLTSSIDVRNAMKKQGFEAVHILELIYGMGPSNVHLEHTHESHDHDHDAPPQIRDTQFSEEEQAALADLFSREKQQRNLQELHDMLLSLFWGE